MKSLHAVDMIELWYVRLHFASYASELNAYLRKTIGSFQMWIYMFLVLTQKTQKKLVFAVFFFAFASSDFVCSIWYPRTLRNYSKTIF